MQSIEKHVPAYKIPEQSLFETLNENTPGPAQYHPDKSIVQERAPAYTIGSKYLTKIEDENPGVGEYNLE